MSNKNQRFKEAAIEILQKTRKEEGLHYTEITKRAIDKGLIKTKGKTPSQTMYAILRKEMIEKGQESRIRKTISGHFIYLSKKEKLKEPKYCTSFLDKKTNKQRGQIIENRVAEIITLYGEKKRKLTCYKPIADDEGVDLIVKDRNSDKVVFVQVKGKYGCSKPEIKLNTKSKSKIRNSSKYMIEKREIADKIYSILNDM